MDDIEELFAKMVQTAPTGKRKEKKKEPVEPLEAVFKDMVSRVKAKEKAKKGYQSGNGYDYVKVWNEDNTDYKYIPKARAKWAEYYGKAPEDHQIVFFRNRRLKGEAKYAKENLLLGYRAGVSLDLLTCKNCGCRGSWEVSSAPDGEDRGPE